MRLLRKASCPRNIGAEALSALDRWTSVAVFLAFALAWFLFIQSAYKFEAVWWFHYLLLSRIALAVLATVWAIISWVRPSANAISTYCLIGMAVQSVASILEGPRQIEFYQYIPYFVLISALSYNGSITNWFRRVLPIVLCAVVVPLFFKDRSYFSSVGTFAFYFTTPIAMLFISFIVAKINSGRFEALRKNIALQSRLLQVESRQRLEIAAQLEHARRRIEEDAANVALAKIAQQVAHDIRSPLASLNTVLENSRLGERQASLHMRNAVNRIREITNNLLQLGASPLNAHSTLGSESSDELRKPSGTEFIVDQIVSEKRVQYSSVRSIERTLESSYGSFTTVDKAELGRAISNLIDNAIEATTEAGVIKVATKSTRDSISVEIWDNGHGIPPDVLGRLGERGFSYGKGGSGNGLGLYHAKTTVESWGGSLKIDSKVGEGTTVTITLPASEPPEWFLPELKVPENGHVVVLDDDPSIHEAWRRRLGSLDGLRFLSFKTSAEIIDWYRKTMGGVENALYLCDHELAGSKETGLDVIDMLGIAANAVLVTGRSDEEPIQSRCVKSAVKMIPKSLMSQVPIVRAGA